MTQNTPAPADLVEAVARILPIRVRNTQDYAEITFGDGSSHSTQAMTMNPEAWEAIEAAQRRAASTTPQPDPRDRVIAELRAVLQNFSIQGPDDDGLMWLIMHGRGTTGQGMVNLGERQRLCAQLAVMLEEDRRTALAKSDNPA